MTNLLLTKTIVIAYYVAFRLVSSAVECPSTGNGTWHKYDATGDCYSAEEFSTLQPGYDAGVTYCGQFTNSTTNVVGNLLSIHSQGENDFIANNLQPQGLLGLRVSCTTSKDSSCLSWADGSPIDYENFDTGEPQGSLGCARFEFNAQDLAKWVTTNCTADVEYFLCKVAPPVATTTPSPSSGTTTPSPSSGARAITTSQLLPHLLAASAGLLLYWIAY